MPPTEPDNLRIETAIKKRYSDASGFQLWKTDGQLAHGVAYYIEFTTNGLLTASEKMDIRLAHEESRLRATYL